MGMTKETKEENKSPFLETIEKKEEKNLLDTAIYSTPITFFKFNSEEKKFDKTGDCEIFFFKYKKEESDEKEIQRIAVLQNRLVVKLDFLKTFDCEPNLDKENNVIKFTAIDDSKYTLVACKFIELEKAEEVLKYLNQ